MSVQYMITVAMGFAAQFIIIMCITLDLKIKKQWLPAVVPAIVLIYCPIVYLAYDSKTLWISLILEVSAALFLVAVCNRGSMWRNFIISWVGFKGGNLIFAIESSIWSLVTGRRTFIAYDDSANEGLIPEMLVMAFDTMIAALILKKVFRRSYRGDGQIFRILTLVLVTFSIGGIYIRLNYLEEKKKTPEDDLMNTFNMYAVIALLSILTIYILIYIYTRMEMANLKTIKAELEKEHELHEEQYAEILENENKLKAVKEKIEEYRDNQKPEYKESTLAYIHELFGEGENTWMLPLSGSITVDSVFFRHYREFSQNKIIFEYHVENPKQLKIKDIDAAVLFDSLLNVAGHYAAGCEKDRWILLNARLIGDTPVIKLEFGKSTEDTVEDPKWYEGIKRKRDVMHGLRIAKRIAQTYDGTMDISDMGEEAAVTLMLEPGDMS